jgi:hypothetical protein
VQNFDNGRYSVSFGTQLVVALVSSLLVTPAVALYASTLRRVEIYPGVLRHYSAYLLAAYMSEAGADVDAGAWHKFVASVTLDELVAVHEYQVLKTRLRQFRRKRVRLQPGTTGMFARVGSLREFGGGGGSEEERRLVRAIRARRRNLRRVWGRLQGGVRNHHQQQQQQQPDGESEEGQEEEDFERGPDFLPLAADPKGWLSLHSPAPAASPKAPRPPHNDPHESRCRALCTRLARRLAKNDDVEPPKGRTWIWVCSVPLHLFLLAYYVVCFYYTLAFGFRVGDSLVLAWLPTVVLSLVIDFFIVQPIFIVFRFAIMRNIVERLDAAKAAVQQSYSDDGAEAAPTAAEGGTDANDLEVVWTKEGKEAKELALA